MRREGGSTCQKRSFLKLLIGGAMLPLTAMLAGAPAQAQNPSEVKVGLLVPLSGIYARPGAVMRMGAEMAIERINAQGGVKALGGAKLKLVLLDSGDTTEKAKNAAQRMVAQETDLVAATGSLPQLVHAGCHRGDRARQPADADPVLLGPDHLARLQVHLPDLGDGRFAGRAVAAGDRQDRRGGDRAPSRRRWPSSPTTRRRRSRRSSR